MPNRPGHQKSGILLDWFNVTYRTLFVAAVALVAVGGGGGYFVYLTLIYAGSPKSEARLAIGQAEDALEKAGPATQQDAASTLKQAAQRLLAEARRQYDASNYEDARRAAVESKLNSEKALAISRGESAREVQFYRIEGDVKVKRVRELIWVDAERGMTLAVGDQIKTSSRSSAQIIYFNGSITTVKPGSLLEIKDLYDNPATRVQQVRERLREGRVTASTREAAAEGSYHEVATDTTVAQSADRTDFEVAYDRAKSTTEVQVFSGSATLTAGQGAPVTLGSAEKVDVDGQEQVSAVEKLPPSPVLAQPVDQRIFLMREGGPPTVDLSWDPVDGAVSYRLQISSAPLFAEPMVDLKDLRTTAASLPGVREGGYYWRVAAMFDEGKEGPFAAARKFKVLAGVIAQANDSTPPTLSIDDFLVFATQVIVRGRTEPGALLTIVGNRVDIADDGSFTTVVSLTRGGSTKVHFVAQDMAGNETRVERVATVDAY